MSDWRKLPAGKELDKVIAERLGLSTSEGFTSSGAYNFIRAYSQCVDIALALWKYDLVFINLGWNPQAQWRHWHCQVSDGANSVNAHAKTPALAVCRAWLEWREKLEAINVK